MNNKWLISGIFTSILLVLSGCQHSSGAVWEDTKTLSRYIQRSGNKFLLRNNQDSKLVHVDSEFTGPSEEEFIPLSQKDLKIANSEHVIPQPKDLIINSSSSPTIDLFREPSHELVSIFKAVHFNTDDHVLRNQDYFHTLDQIADYLKRNPQTYLFVSGHCDERASEAYNLALGLRRANFIRSSLVKKGIDANHIYTISFGKEMPRDSSHTKEAWAKNRRAEFKLYDKSLLVKK